MPVHLPVTIPVDPHVLAQWRFDERRRWEDQRDPALQAVSMVLGRWPDRLEFRTRAEVPGVSESARAVAAAAGAPAYRAQLMDIVGKIVQSTGLTDEPHGDAHHVDAPAVDAPPADEAADAGDSDDWLSKLDAHLTSAPAPAPAAQDATHVAPPPAPDASSAPAPADDLPDFLAPWETPEPAEPAPAGEEAPVPFSPAPVVPPLEPEPVVPPFTPEPEPFSPSPVGTGQAVPVLDFVVEPDDAPSGNGAEPDAAQEEPGLPSFDAPDAEPAPASDELPFFDTDHVPPSASTPAPEPSVETPAFVAPPFAPPQAAAPAPPAAEAPAPAPVAEAPAPAPVAAAPATVAPPTPAPAADVGGIPGRLAALGRDMGLDVSGRAAGGAAASARPPVDAAVQVLLDSLDVVWTQGGRFVAAFLVAPRPAVNGLLLLSDIAALRPGAEIPFFVVAPDAERAALRGEAARPTFARQSPPLAESFRFVPAEKLEQSLANVGAFLRYLRPEFVEALAEHL